jgi:hypothetical protein
VWRKKKLEENGGKFKLYRRSESLKNGEIRLNTSKIVLEV